jgi:hypothetical protein
LKPPIQPINFIHPSAQQQYSTLPAWLLGLADVATNGECFWPGDWASDAAHALAAQGLFITGGEVYCRRPVGWAAYLGEWVTSAPALSDTSWAESVARGLADAVRAIQRDPAAWGEPGESPQNLRFFFASTSEPAG